MFLGFENIESMAGSSKQTDGSALDCLKILHGLRINGISVKCGKIDFKLSKLLNHLVSRCLEELCYSKYARSLHPMLGDGKLVELLKFFSSKRKKGGYNVQGKRMDLKLDLESFLMDVDMKDVGYKDVQSCIESVGGKNCGVGEKYGVVTELCVGIEEEKEAIRKTKRECYSPLLDWLKRVAKDPCDPGTGSLPERSKWKAYGREHVWKQALLAKEAMLLKVNAKQSIWQKRLKMHPGMYNDPTRNPVSRCSQRLISVKETRLILPSRKSQLLDCSESSSSTGSHSEVDNEDYFWLNDYKKKRIPLGRFFQAQVPQWTGETYKSETRWLGTRIWPPENTEKQTSLSERARLGKRKRPSCGCRFQGSLECVRLHIAEKRSRVKLELGSAFGKWKFDTMGEEVSLRWSRHEEKKFASIIKSYPESTGIRFWDELMIYFKNKTMQALVSYYFNVYLLRRRAHQNRSDPGNVDSDDDELEKVGRELNKSTGSILCSHMKIM